MLRKPLLSLVFAILLGVAFAYGLARLFSLRYAIGDVYPPYSSLRADALGTKAIADALAELPGVLVRRNFKPLEKLRDKGAVTLVYTGVSHHSYWTEKELEAFNALVLGGSRVVITFFPVERKESERMEKRSSESARQKKKEKVEGDKPEQKKKKSRDKKEKEKSPKDAPDKDEKSGSRKEDKTDRKIDDDEIDKSLVGFDTVAKRWGFEFDYLPEEKKAFDRHAALVEPGGHLETDLSWHSALYFRDLKPHWKVLYMSGTMPVVIERQFGAGSIILVADAYGVSNEALRKERHSKFLARLFSGPPSVIFDEDSHELREEPGIAGLALKYRLHGVIAGLALLAVLFVWKNAIRFIPPYAPQFAEGDVVAGKESAEGFINLLRRSIAPSAILATCVAEWRKSSAHLPREQAIVEETWSAEQARPARERNSIATYQTISRALTRKK